MPVFQSSRIKDIFAEAQYSVTAHKNLQNQLKTLHQSSPEKAFFKTFTQCLRVPLTCGEKTSPVERTLDFATHFITSFITKKIRPEGGSDDEDEDELPQFVTDIFKFLCENAADENQTIRFRICQFINKLLNGLGNEACLDDDLCDVLCERLMERLRDKAPSVRTQAVRALYRLQDPTDASCRVTSAFIFHLSSDPSADVRGTILTNIAVSNNSVRGIVERTLDTNETVRRIAFVRIAELNIQRFSIDQRNRLLERGLKDQSEKVKKSVTNDLLRAWLEFFKGNFIAYLHALDCEHATETSTLSLETMFKSTKTGLTSAIEQIGSLQGSDKLIPAEELNPENVLLWKVVTKYLENHPEVAEERPVDEPLEELVPELTSFCKYILKYFEEPLSEAEPWVLAQREYVLGQLLEMCEGFDLADEMGRANLRSMCQSLLLHKAASERVVPQIVKILVKVIPDADDRLQFLAEVIAEVQDTSSDAENPNAPEVPEMSAEEKRQLEIKEAKIRMKLNELTEDQDEAAKAKDFGRAQQLLEECNKLKDELKALSVAPPPAPVASQPVSQEARTETVIITDKDKLQKCLCIVKEMMQPPSITSLTPTLRSLMHNFVMPCLQQQAEDPVIKNMALEAMGLFCYLDIELAKQHFVYMFCFQIANDEVCETALKITFDLLHLYGLETFDVEIAQNDDEDRKKRGKKKKKNLFVTDTQEDEFEEDEDETLSQTVNTSRANTSNLIFMLTSLLGSVSTSMRNLAMKGLCKLLLTCRMTSSALLSRLMVMWYSPVTDGDEDFRQPMAAFLKALSTMCPRGQEMLEQAFLPTLRTLRDAPADSPLSEVDIESVTKLFISLTRPGTNRFHKKQNTHIHNAMAVTLCNELLNQEDSYFDDGMFLRCLLQLELSFDDPVFRQDLLKLVASLKEVFQMRKERALIKYVERFEKMVETVGPDVVIAVPEVDNTAQTEQLDGVDNTARTDQLNSTTASVVKKSRANAKILKPAAEDDDDDVASDHSIDFNEADSASQATNTVIMESPRPGSPCEPLATDSQEEVEEPERQDAKRRKIAEDTKKKGTEKVVSSPAKASEPAAKTKATRRGRRLSSEEETEASTPRKNAGTEETPRRGRRGSSGEEPGASSPKRKNAPEERPRRGQRVSIGEEPGASSPKRKNAPEEGPRRGRRVSTGEEPGASSPKRKNATEVATRRGRPVSSEKESGASSPKRKNATEVATKRGPVSPEEESGARKIARKKKAAEKTGDHRVEEEDSEEEETAETRQRETRRKRRSVEADAGPAKKLPFSPSKVQATDSPQNKRNKIVKVMLDVCEVSDGRPRREVKLTAKAVAYKEDLTKKTVNRSPSGSPERPEASPKQPRKQTDSQSDSSPVSVRRNRRSGGVELPAKNKAAGKSKPSSADDSSSSDMFSKSPPPRRLPPNTAAGKSKPSSADDSSSSDMFSKSPPPRRLPPNTAAGKSKPSSADDSSASEMFSRSMPSCPEVSPQRPKTASKNLVSSADTSGDMFSDSPPSRPLRSQKLTPVNTVKLKRPTRSGRESTGSVPERLSRSRTRADEASPAAQPKKPAKKVVTKPPAKEVPVPEKRAARTKTQSQESASSDSPLPASSSSENSTKPATKVPVRKAVPPSSSEDSEPERLTRRSGPRMSSTPASTKKTTLRDEVILRAVDRVRRSGVLDSPASSPVGSPNSSGQEDLIERAVDRIRRSLIASPESSPSSSPGIARKPPSSSDSAKKPSAKKIQSSDSSSKPAAAKKIPPSDLPKKPASAKKPPSSDSASNDSPSRSTRSGASQPEASKRASRSANSPVVTNQKTSAKQEKPATSKTAEKPKAKSSLTRTSSGSTLGRTSSGSLSSPSMSTRSNDLLNNLRTRKRM